MADHKYRITVSIEFLQEADKDDGILIIDCDEFSFNYKPFYTERFKAGPQPPDLTYAGESWTIEMSWGRQSNEQIPYGLPPIGGPMADLLPMLKRGDRVRVIATRAPTCRTGTVMDVIHDQGYRVWHDEPAWVEGFFAGQHDFNWTFSEVVGEAA